MTSRTPFRQTLLRGIQLRLVACEPVVLLLGLIAPVLRRRAVLALTGNLFFCSIYAQLELEGGTRLVPSQWAENLNPNPSSTLGLGTPA